MRYDRQIFFATLLLCVSSIAGYYFFVHRPFEVEIFRLELERRKAVRQSVDIINFKNLHGDLEEVLVDLDQQRDDLERALPTQLSQGDFINYIQSTALTNQIRGVPTRDENLPITRLPIRVRVECTYFKLLDFLKTLEGSERLIDIENFKATSTGDGTQLICELELTIFAAEMDGEDDDQIFDGG